MSPCLRRRPLSAQELTEKRSTWPTDFWKTHTRMHTHSYNLCRVHMLHCTQKHKHSHSSKLANTQDTLWCFDLSVPHCMCACLVQCKACDTTNLPRSLIFENLTTLRCDLIGWFQWLGHSHLLDYPCFFCWLHSRHLLLHLNILPMWKFELAPSAESSSLLRFIKASLNIRA